MPQAPIYPEKMEPGQRYCNYCQPDVFPDFPRYGSDHAAVRFHDYRKANVMLGGQVLTTVYEAYQGDDSHPGWIIRGVRGELGGFVVCPRCYRETLKEFVFTNVEIHWHALCRPS